MKKLLSVTGVFALLYLLAYALFYVCAYLSSAAALGYLAVFIRDFALFILPLLSLVFLVRAYFESGLKRTAIHALVLSTAYLFYALPFYFVEFSLSGYLISELLVLLLVQLFASLLISYSTLVLLCLAAVLSFRIFSKKAGVKNANILEICDTGSRFDTQNPINFTFMCSVGALFVYYLAVEIIDTVSFLLSNVQSLRPSEIIYIPARYVFILFTAVISYLSARRLWKRVVNRR